MNLINADFASFSFSSDLSEVQFQIADDFAIRPVGQFEITGMKWSGVLFENGAFQPSIGVTTDFEILIIEDSFGTPEGSPTDPFPGEAIAFRQVTLTGLDNGIFNTAADYIATFDPILLDAGGKYWVIIAARGDFTYDPVSNTNGTAWGWVGRQGFGNAFQGGTGFSDNWIFQGRQQDLVIFGSELNENSPEIFWVHDSSSIDAVYGGQSDLSEHGVILNTDDVFGNSPSPPIVGLATDNQNLFLTDGENVYRSNLNGTCIQTIVSFPSPMADLNGVATDGDFLYLLDRGQDSIFRCGLDGSNLTPLINQLNTATTAISVCNGLIFWTAEEGIYRANIDGSESQLLIPRMGSDVDTNGVLCTNSALYFTEQVGLQTDDIYRCDHDGKNIVSFISPDTFDGARISGGLGTDGEFIYWATESTLGSIYRTSLDGESTEETGFQASVEVPSFMAVVNESQTSVLLGDVNLDGLVNLLDVAPFVDVLSNGLFQNEADINQDGVVNLLDVQPFIGLLTG